MVASTKTHTPRSARQGPRLDADQERTRLRNSVLDAASVVDAALDSDPAEATGMLLDLVMRLEILLDEVAG